MFDNITLAQLVTDVGTLGALIAVPVAIVAAMWGTRRVAGLFKGFIR